MSLRTNLQKNIEDILYYDKENAIMLIIKIVWEAIMKAERDYYLENCKTPNKGNGYYERLVRAINKYFKINVPRDRLATFKSLFLEAIKQNDLHVQTAALKLYNMGLSTREIKKFLAEIFGKSYSPTAISNLGKNLEEQRQQWLSRKLDSEYFFVYIDAIQISVRRGNVDSEAFYIVMALNKENKRDILGIYNIPEESATGWEEVLKDLKKRGMKETLLFIADGLSGLDVAVSKVFPNVSLQRCLVHKIRNILLSARAGDKREISSDFKKVFVKNDSGYILKKGTEALKNFISKWKIKYPKIVNKFKEKDISHYFAYLRFPPDIQKMICTTNWIENYNKSIRRTTKIRNSFPSPESALNLITSYTIELIESGYLKYPITSFSDSKEKLLTMLKKQSANSQETFL